MFQKQAIYKASEGRVNTNYFEQANQLVPMKEIYPWLTVAPSQSLQQAIVDLHKAYENFFDGSGFPKPKRRDDLFQSFRYPQGGQLKIDGRRVYLPNIGWIKFKKSMELPSEIKHATVSYDQDHWYIAICGTAMDFKTGHKFVSEVESYDAGVKNHLTDTKNNVHMLPTKTKQEKNKLKRLERQISKKELGSNNRKKAATKARKYNRKLLNRINDARHKLTTNIAKTHRKVAVEKLRVKNMTGSARGTVEAPGKNVRQKAGLNRTLLEIGLGEIRRQLEYKCKRYGGECITVDPANTSRRCPICEHTSKANRPTRDLFLCVMCLFTAPADQVGAINIKHKAAGHAVIACGRVKKRSRKNRFKKERKAEPDPKEAGTGPLMLVIADTSGVEHSRGIPVL